MEKVSVGAPFAVLLVRHDTTVPFYQKEQINRVKGRKMNKVLALETNKYAIKIENFEGPLDLLLHLIDKNKMDIYDIKI